MFLSEIAVSLLVRLWVEIPYLHLHYHLSDRQPPCEAVSWNSRDIARTSKTSCQPPCEAVSWNTSKMNVTHKKLSSASLWGCELKYGGQVFQRHRTCQPPCEAVSWNINRRNCRLWDMVSLLVRLWVEITACHSETNSIQSASLWGCELKYHNCKVLHLLQ